MQEISSKVEELKAANSRVKVLEKDLRGLQQHVQGELMKVTIPTSSLSVIISSNHAHISTNTIFFKK